MLDIIKNISPQRRLKICTYSLITTISLFFILVMCSLSIASSNLMIINELTTDQQIQMLQTQHGTYMSSQKCIIAFDVLLVITLPLLLFSVFKFYTKGNLIIIIINSVFMSARWVSGVIFQAGEKELRDGYNNLWKYSEEGTNQQCLNETCGQSVLNYVICGRLKLWDEAMTYELSLLIVAIPLCIGVVFAAYWTNRLDMKVVQFTEADQTAYQ